MRIARAVLLGMAIASMAACGMIAGVDSYQLGALTTDDGSTPQVDGTVPNNPADGSNLQPSSQDSAASDSAIIVDIGDAAIVDATDNDAPDDTGAPSDAACTLTKNGTTCGKSSNGQDAAGCCSSTCDEQHNCTGNSCTSEGKSCSNDISLGFPYQHGKSDCCVNSFCRPGKNEYVSGTCSGCVGSGQSPPVIVVEDEHGNPQFTVVYDDACCSLSTNQFSGKCN